jgi:hypothetical protein
VWARLRNRIRRQADPSRPESAERAIAASERSLEKALGREAEVREMAAEIRYHRVEVNHIAKRLRESLGGH